MKISFVIPAYQAVTWLPHAVESCLEQTYKDVEIIVVNDGSTDRTPEYLKWLGKNPRAKIINNEQNLGRSASRNIGNKAAQGDIICVLDADDLATPNRAEIVAEKFRRTKVDYLHGASTVIDVLGRVANITKPDVFNRERAVECLVNRIVHSTVAYTREIAEKFPYQGGDVCKLGIDDWMQQWEVHLAGKAIDFVPQRLACYRVLNSQITGNRDEEMVKRVKREWLAKALNVEVPVHA